MVCQGQNRKGMVYRVSEWGDETQQVKEAGLWCVRDRTGNESSTVCQSGETRQNM